MVITWFLHSLNYTNKFQSAGVKSSPLTAINELSETFPHFIPVPLQSGTELNTEIDCSLYSQGGLQQHAFIIAHTHKCATHFIAYQTLNDKHMSGRKILTESPSIQWTLWFLINQSQGYDGRQTDMYESPVAIYCIYMVVYCIVKRCFASCNRSFRVQFVPPAGRFSKYSLWHT